MIKHLKKYLSIFALLLICLVVSLNAYAYENMLEVASFAIEENSLTAKNTPVFDNNNQKCALIIIKGMGDENLRFNVGNSFLKVEEKIADGEKSYLLWIPEGVVKVTISSDSKSFEPTEYYFKPRVRRAETYLMNLQIERLKAHISKQFLEFIIEPKNASIEVNDELWKVSNGIAYRQLPKGVYRYQVKAKDYHTETGLVELKDLTSKQTIPISLKPKFGWLTLISTLSDITFFIDDEPYYGSLNRIKLGSGSHTLKAAKELYQTFSQEVVIEDSNETSISIDLKPNYSNVTLSVKNGGDIFIDDKHVGKDIWTGKLSIGSYKVEFKKDNHTSMVETFTVTKTDEQLKFEYPALRPIFGTISIESIPSHATIKIDDVDYGTTPLFVPELLIGSHNLTLTLDGFKPISSTIIVQEANETKVNYTFEDQHINPIKSTPNQNSINYSSLDQCESPSDNDEENLLGITSGEDRVITTSPLGADIYIDGQWIGKSPCTIKNDRQNHTIEIRKAGYTTFKEYIHLGLISRSNYNLVKSDEIMVYTFPPRARIYIDGENVGTSPCAIKKDNALHNIKIEKNGYFSISENIGFSDKTNISFNLTKINPRTRLIYNPKNDD